MVCYLNIDYKKSAHLEEQLNVETNLVGLKLSLALFEQSIFNQSGQLLAKANVKVMALDEQQQPCMMATILQQ